MFKNVLAFLNRDPEAFSELKWLHEYKIRTLMPLLTTAVGRRLMSHALQAACVSTDIPLITELLTFIKKNQILVYLAPANIKFLILN